MWILSFDHVFTSHNIFVNSKRTYTSTRDSQGTPTDYIFQIEGLTQMHDYDDDLLYKNVILLTTCIFYWHIWWRWGWRPPLQGRRKKNLRGGEVLFVSAPFRSVIFYRPPPKYIFRFNPPPFSRGGGGGVISAAYTSPPSFLRPCFLEKPRFIPKIFFVESLVYMILWNIGLGGGGVNAPFPTKMLD